MALGHLALLATGRRLSRLPRRHPLDLGGRMPGHRRPDGYLRIPKMKPRTRWAIGLSLAIHLWFGVIIATMPPRMPNRRPGGNSDTPGEPGEGHGQKSIKLKVGPIRGADGSIIELGVGKDGLPCYEWFGGIGITHEGTGFVDQVYKGYPAERLGLRKGDFIPDIAGVIGDVGTPVTFTYFRDSQATTVTVKRERICVRR